MAKTILITGAGSGFGKGAAVELAARGHRVIATTETAEQAEALSAEHPEVTALKLDVTDPNDVGQVAAIDPDVLINNAGFGVMAPLSHVPLDRLKAGFEVNVFGMVAVSQAAIPGMKAKGAGSVPVGLEAWLVELRTVKSALVRGYFRLVMALTASSRVGLATEVDVIRMAFLFPLRAGLLGLTTSLMVLVAPAARFFTR